MKGRSQAALVPVSSKAGGLLAVLMMAGPAAVAQKAVAVGALQPLAAGVTLPVRLDHSLAAGKAKVGSKVAATTTQRVPVAPHLYLHHGVKLYGEVVTSIHGDGTAAHPSVLGIRFTTMQYKHQSVPLLTKAIAIANFVQVGETALPTNGGSDRGNNSPASWTTAQVGGDLLDRSGWIGELVDGSLEKVGSADYFGVYTLPRPGADGGGMPFPRALGVFSASASGLYGMEEGTTLSSAGGTITLRRPAGKLLLRLGDNLLLEVVGAGQGISQGRGSGSTH